MSINGVIYQGDNPKWAAQVEAKLAAQDLQMAVLLSQIEYLKGSTQ